MRLPKLVCGEFSCRARSVGGSERQTKPQERREPPYGWQIENLFWVVCSGKLDAWLTAAEGTAGAPPDRHLYLLAMLDRLSQGFDTVITVNTPTGNYASIRSAALSRIQYYASEATRTPFDREQLGPHARALKATFDAHTTEDKTVGSACVDCGQPWPCGGIELIFTPVKHLD